MSGGDKFVSSTTRALSGHAQFVTTMKPPLFYSLSVPRSIHTTVTTSAYSRGCRPMSLIFVPATATLRDTATLCAHVRDRERDMEVAADVQLGSLKPQIMTQTEMAEVQVIYYLIWKKNNKKDCTKIKRTKGKAYTSMN
jgi:hypothetical protein